MLNQIFVTAFKRLIFLTAMLCCLLRKCILCAMMQYQVGFPQTLLGNRDIYSCQPRQQMEDGSLLLQEFLVGESTYNKWNAALSSLIFKFKTVKEHFVSQSWSLCGFVQFLFLWLLLQVIYPPKYGSSDPVVLELSSVVSGLRDCSLSWAMLLFSPVSNSAFRVSSWSQASLPPVAREFSA